MSQIALEPFVQLLKDAAAEAGVELKIKGQVLVQYADDCARQLAALVGQDGFDLALVAERDKMMLEVAGLVVDEADATEQRFMSIVEGALSILARVTVL